MDRALNNSIDEIVKENLGKECPTCHQNITNSFEENYRLLLVRQNLIKERETIRLELNDVQSNIDDLYSKLNQTVHIGDEYKEKLQADANVISLGERADIVLSGASKVQAFIAQYLTIYKMSIENKSTIHIPMFIDTFLKDDFNNIEIDKTAMFIFSSLEDTLQSFIFIADNEQTLESIKDYKFTKLELKETFSIFNNEFMEIYKYYALYIE
ncbi:hypothetical protein ACIQ57_07150 [Lysinibacillus xylanilyticus]|uniref:hypothetical protein n=1 Tax=Lysinibacillus xylanilyticus TaxID=582475 RepID=UPI0037F478CE